VANPQPFFDYETFGDAQWSTFFLSRYSTVPSMFLLALIPLAAAVAGIRARTVGLAILGSFLVLQAVYVFPSGVARQDGPVWTVGVLEGRQVCLADPALISYPVPIAPRGWMADRVEIPCRQLVP
jgi:hypothetical protein